MSYPIYNICLLDPYLIKKICPEVPDSVDDALMTSSIIDVQESSLINLLGCSLYQQILLEQSGNTLTAPNQYIYERFITRIIAKGVLIKLMFLSSYQFENQGVRKKISDQSDYVDREEMNVMRQLYQNDIDRLAHDMIYYMNNNTSLYPLFYESQFCVPCGSKTRESYKALDISGF